MFLESAYQNFYTWFVALNNFKKIAWFTILKTLHIIFLKDFFSKCNQIDMKLARDKGILSSKFWIKILPSKFWDGMKSFFYNTNRNDKNYLRTKSVKIVFLDRIVVIIMLVTYFVSWFWGSVALTFPLMAYSRMYP